MFWKCVSVSICLLVPALGLAEVRVVEEIVAKVNGDIITRGEIERRRETLAAELKQQGVDASKMQEMVKGREKDTLREQIDELLLVQKGKELSINVDPEITRRIAEIQANSKITDPDKFQLWVREQAGVPFEDFKSQMKNQLLTQRVIGQEVGSKINIPDAEQRKYYEEHKKDFLREEQVFLREILISTEGKTPAEAAAAEKKAKDILARARKGEKFHELARDNSDSATARNFGDLGAWKRGELKKEIEDIVFQNGRNYVSDLISMPNGFLILKIEERHEAGQAEFEEVRNEVMERLYMPRMQPKVREYLTKLREDAFLEIREGYIDSGAAPGKDTSWKDPLELRPETTTKEEVAARKKRRFLKIFPLPGGGGDKKSESDMETKMPPAPK